MMDFGSGPVNLKVSKSQTCPDLSPTSRVFFSGSNEKFDSISIESTTATATQSRSPENESNKLEDKRKAQLPFFGIEIDIKLVFLFQNYSSLV